MHCFTSLQWMKVAKSCAHGRRKSGRSGLKSAESSMRRAWSTIQPSAFTLRGFSTFLLKKFQWCPGFLWNTINLCSLRCIFSIKTVGVVFLEELGWSWKNSYGWSCRGNDQWHPCFLATILGPSTHESRKKKQLHIQRSPSQLFVLV